MINTRGTLPIGKGGGMFLMDCLWTARLRPWRIPRWVWGMVLSDTREALWERFHP